MISAEMAYIKGGEMSRIELKRRMQIAQDGLGTRKRSELTASRERGRSAPKPSQPQSDDGGEDDFHQQ